MTVQLDVRYASSPEAVRCYDTQHLRDDFLVEEIMTPGRVRLVYSHYDRLILGGAVPSHSALTLDPVEPLKADTFLARRELGVINVGGPGRVTVDGEPFDLDPKDALYVGRGARSVTFDSEDAATPARFYLNSAPAHTAYPSRRISPSDAEVVTLGAPETSNHRTLRKLIVSSVVDVCQLQMGLTELHTGSVWNTMPAHTHDRRMEAYFYFGLPEGQAVCHFMGTPTETRPLWVHNEQAVISPPWSIHAGVGTSSYAFIWGMAGENLDYSDMDGVSPDALR